MVIDDHASSPIGLFTSVFPYNSFYMPLFVMVSGFLYKERPLFKHLLKNIKRILLPYVVWCFIGDFVARLLQAGNISFWYRPINEESIIRMFCFGPLSSINYAGWFAIMLFYVSVIYRILDIFKFNNRIVNDYAKLFLFIVGGAISTFYCQMNTERTVLSAVITRTLFYLQFYHIGYMFRKYWKKCFDDYNKVVVILVALFINIVSICVFGDSINFYATKEMSHINIWYLPLITSTSGSVFWYSVCNWLGNTIGEQRFIRFVSDNTFHIMMCHVIFINIPNYFIVNKILSGSLLYGDFEVETFMNHAVGVRYSFEVQLVSVVIGVVLSLLLCYLIQSIKQYVINNLKM